LYIHSINSKPLKYNFYLLHVPNDNDNKANQPSYQQPTNSIEERTAFGSRTILVFIAFLKLAIASSAAFFISAILSSTAINGTMV
jgi:hypothetical protein